MLVTGGARFIGSHAVDPRRAEHHKIRVLDSRWLRTTPVPIA
jgi:nucleoside-diphosphate-sugar epimerase